MPGPYERHRFLALELVPGALDGATGTFKPTGRKTKAGTHRRGRLKKPALQMA